MCARREEDVHGTHTEVSAKVKIRLSNKRLNLQSKNFFQSFRLQAYNQIDVFNFVMEQLAGLKMFVRNKIAELGPLKIQLSVFVQMFKPTNDNTICGHANTNLKALTTEQSDDEIFEMIDRMNNSIQIFSTGGCGFVVRKIDHLDININNFNLSEVAVTLGRLSGKRESFEYSKHG